MEETMLSINSPIQFDTSITNYEIHAHQPYGSMSFENSDEIRISIQNQDLYVLPSKSSLHISGSLLQAANSAAPVSTKIVNNGILHLFEEIRYELNGIEIDKTKNAGITTTIKNYLTLNNQANFENAGWIGTKDDISLTNGGYFDVCIPLQMILGFAEDYRKLIVNAKHELILVRSRTDSNAIVGTAAVEEKVKLKIDKIEWLMPYVKLSDKKRIEMMKFIQRDPLISMSFRSFEIYEYPLLPATTKHVWSVKTATQLEKPRFVILAFQSNRKNQWNKNASHFDHCEIQDIKLFLNSISYPYGNLGIDISKKQFAILYEMFMNFTESYYGKRMDNSLSKSDFLAQTPFIIIDCSKQNEMLKYGPVDVRLEFETKTVFPTSTAAYCLILHDRIVEYKPISGMVQKLS